MSRTRRHRGGDVLEAKAHVDFGMYFLGSKIWDQTYNIALDVTYPSELTSSQYESSILVATQLVERPADLDRCGDLHGITTSFLRLTNHRAREGLGNPMPAIFEAHFPKRGDCGGYHRSA